MFLQLDALTEDQLVSEEEKAALHARWLESTKSKKRKKPATGKDTVQMDNVPVVTSTYVSSTLPFHRTPFIFFAETFRLSLAGLAPLP